MSNNWNQPPNNNYNEENNRPPQSGGLLKKYKNQPPSNAPMPPSDPGLNSSPLKPGQFMPPSKSGLLRPPGSSMHGLGPQMPPPSQQQPAWEYQDQPQRSQAPMPPQRQGLLSNTMDVMRQFSGKMAALAGYQHKVEPPAPYLERYNPMTPSGSGIDDMPMSQQNKQWKRSRAIRIARHMRNRRERWQRGPARIWSTVAIVLLFIVVFTSFGSSAYGYTYYQQQLPRMNELANLNVAQSTRIYDRNGILLYETYETDTNSRDRGRRTLVEIKDIPKVMQDAMVAIEDKSFWTNSGVDPQGILRAASSGSGGGSTLTQQIIKNLSGADDPTVWRKIPEAAMAIGLTQNYTKAEILQMYFNIAPFGSSDNGIESAVQTIFGLKPTIDPKTFKYTPAVTKLYLNSEGKKDPILGLARASLMAGIPNNPSRFDPTGTEKMRQRALDRQGLVLNLMIDQGMKVDGKPITPDMAKKARELTVKMKFQPYKAVKRAPHFVDWVINKVATALGNGDVNKGWPIFKRAGLNIKTTVDVNLVEYTDRAIKRHLNEVGLQVGIGGSYYAILSRDNNVNTAAALVMDAKTGEILSMVGSSDYNSDNIKIGGSYNVVDPPNNGTGRPPGSTMKPLIYASAFEMGWDPSIVLPDAQTYFPDGQPPAGTAIPINREKPVNGIYSPSSYGNTYNAGKNPILDNLRYATANSFNVPAVKALQFVGTENALNFTQRLGLTTLKNNGLSMALGAQDVPLIQMVSGYQTLANAGKRVPPQGILDIWDNKGTNLFHYDPNPAKVGSQIVSPEVSYMMTSVLMDQPARAYEFGSNTILSFADKDGTCAVNAEACPYQVATKTGTTDEFRDNLAIGYTPDVVVGVWAGNANNEPMNNVVGITGAAPIWHSVIQRTLGWCNQTTGTFADNIPCGDATYNFRFSGEGKTQWKFTQPPGLTKASTSRATGLLGSENYDWVINGLQPISTGSNGSTQFVRGVTPDQIYGKKTQ